MRTPMLCASPCRRFAALCTLATLALVATLALTGREVAGAVDEARCASATRLRSDPTMAAFKQCAGVSPIPYNCCLKLLPFITYADCLQLPKYKAMADEFLAPAVNVDRALKECLGS